MRKLLSIVSALALTLAIAAPVAAQTQTSTQVSVSVSAVISLTGIPASITFPSGFPGESLTTPQFTVSIASNAGYAFTFWMTNNFVGDPSGSMPKSALRVNGDNAATAPQVVFDSTPGDGSIPVDMVLNVPGAQAAGTFTGIVTWQAAPAS